MDDAVFLSDHTIEYWIVRGNRLVPAGPDELARIHEWEREREALDRLDQWVRLEQRRLRWQARTHRFRHALTVWEAVADDLAHLLAGWRRTARHLLRTLPIWPRLLPLPLPLHARAADEQRADGSPQSPQTPPPPPPPPPHTPHRPYPSHTPPTPQTP